LRSKNRPSNASKANRRATSFTAFRRSGPQNKLIRNFLRASLTRSDQYTVKNLSPFDWEFVFFILNRGWGQSVMRDVYGVFHGSSVFADHIVLPDTSKGFGQIREPGKGVSLTLATQQISDLLLSHSKLTPETSLRTSHIEQFSQERWRKDVLKKELRPTLNAPTLKRVERFVQQVFQRGQSERLALETGGSVGESRGLNGLRLFASGPPVLVSLRV
jgi:hypothetical protein